MDIKTQGYMPKFKNRKDVKTNQKKISSSYWTLQGKIRPKQKKQ